MLLIRILQAKTRERVKVLFLRFLGYMKYNLLSFAIWHDYSQQLLDPFEKYDIQSY